MKSQQPLLLWLIVLILIAGGVVYAVIAPATKTHSDPWAGLTTEVAPTLSDGKKAAYEEQLADLTAQIAAKEAAHEYALDLYFLRGGYNQKLGHLKAAFFDFQTVVDGDPGNETAWNNMGDLRLQAGDVNGAEIYYQKSIEQNPSELAYLKLYRYYLTYRHDDRFAAIGPLLEKALADVGPSAALYVDLGRFEAEEGHRDKAIAAYRQAAMLDPDNQAVKEEMRKLLQAP